MTAFELIGARLAGAGADDIVPLMHYLLGRAAPPNPLVTWLCMHAYFAGRDTGLEGYAIALMRSSLQLFASSQRAGRGGGGGGGVRGGE
jgi:hypothetical protein